MAPTRSAATLVVAAGLLASCEEPNTTVASLPFDEVFQLAEVVELGEDPSDSVAEVGVFLERRNGGFIVADRLLPRVRTYLETGELEAAFGRFGSGPWEFQGIDGVTEMASGRIVVTSWRNPWLTYLSSRLVPDTLLPIRDQAVFDVIALGPDIVLYGPGRERLATGESDEGGLYHRFVDGRIAWSRWTSPISDKPYWGGLTGGAGGVAVAGDSLFIMTALLYPATILNGAGDSVGTIGAPSPSFRRIPEIERGAFAGTQGGARVRELIATFDLVPRIDVVDSDYLAFTLGRLDEAMPFSPFRVIHTALEIYDRHSGAKLYEDVALPEGAKVLGGGRYLYVLMNPDMPPWRIAKYRLVVGG